MKLPRGQARNRKFARRSKYLVKCMHENCDIVAHATCPNEFKLLKITYFSGLTCFDIAHHPKCKDLFTKIQRKGQFYCRTIPSHPVVQDIKEMYHLELPRRSNRERKMRSRAGRPPTVIRTASSPSELDSITVTTPAGTGDFFSAHSTPEEVITPQKRSIQLWSKTKKQKEQVKPSVQRALRSNSKKRLNTRPKRKAAKYKVARM